MRTAARSGYTGAWFARTFMRQTVPATATTGPDSGGGTPTEENGAMLTLILGTIAVAAWVAIPAILWGDL